MSMRIITKLGTKVTCSEWVEHRILLKLERGRSSTIAHLTKEQASILIDELNKLIQI